jgi:hypothetical protein
MMKNDITQIRKKRKEKHRQQQYHKKISQGQTETYPRE